MKINIFAKGKKYDLTGVFDVETNHVLIYKDSKYRSDITNSLLPHIIRFRNEVLKEYGSDDNKLTDSYDFKSPGAAACVLSGSMANGLDFFRVVDDGRTLNDYLGNKTKIKKSKEKTSETEKPLYLSDERKYKRIYSVGKTALKNSCYLCYVDANHETFVTDNGTQYMEAHHLIPFKYQKDFSASLQVQANIVCLCPQCHRELHYGKNRKVLLKRLYDDRIESLKKCELDIPFEELLKYYEIKE